MNDEVRAAVERYVKGCRKADADQVRGAFAPGARMWGYLGDDYVEMTGEEFADQVVAPAEPASEEYAATIHGIEITGSVASARLDERGFLGADFSNRFGLVRRDGEWRIVSKVFTTV